MSKIVYGVFDTPDHADEALAKIGRGPKVGDTSAITYDGEPSGEELSLSATRTLQWTIAAMVIVGFLGAVIFSFVNPLVRGEALTVANFFFVWSAGSIFGMVAGAVSGMAEPTKSLERPIALARTGKVLVLMSEAGVEEADALRQSEGAEMANVA